MLDLNLDAGEIPTALEDGSEARLYSLVNRVNIACGGHAGDERTMKLALELARSANLLVGAHPSYPDRKNFGRLALQLSVEEISGTVHSQVAALKRVADAFGAKLDHVKPHGALYNQLAQDPSIARAFAEGVRAVSRNLKLVGLAGSSAIAEWKALGFVTLEEAFADRRYRPDGTLVPRTEPGAVITDPAVAVAQLREMVAKGMAQTFCVHGDTPQAEAILRAIRSSVL